MDATVTMHPVAVVGATVVLVISSTATWLTQRGLQRRSEAPASENATFRQWQLLWFAFTIPLAVIAWLIFKATGLQ